MTTEESADINEVHLVGRLGQQVTTRELPSGDEITSFTVIVARSGRLREGSHHVWIPWPARARARIFEARSSHGHLARGWRCTVHCDGASGKVEAGWAVPPRSTCAH
ncbi:MAG TPA: hypothetical protein DDY88_09240 [Actinobacteria bacterium]|nr:hypothetical protein [Actinomycetota bacterium]